jgi:hypothetical protein
MHFAKIENFDLSGNNAIDNLENYIGQSILPRVLEFLALYEKHKKIITIEAEPTNVQIKNALLEAASAKLPATDKDLAEKGQDKNKLRDDDLIGTSLKGDDDGVYVLPDEDDE